MQFKTFNASEEFLSESLEINDYKLYVFSQKNLEKSTNNEDVAFYTCSDKGLVFGVCDGVGGYPMGKEAATEASNTIMNHFDKSSDNIGFLSALEIANKKIRDFKVGARTTAAFSLILDDKVKFYHIGDTEIIYTNARGSLLYYSIPQSPIGYAVEAGLIGQEESMDDPDRNIVSHLLGDEILRFESSSSIEMKKGHTVFIGSDGVFDNISKEKVISLVGAGSFDEGAKELESLLVEAKKNQSWKKNDDISFVMVRKIKS